MIFLYYVILALALLTNAFTLRIRKLPIGRAWEGLREDEIACRSLGINPTNTKLTAFAIGAMFAGFAGSFFATRQGFISPESFTFIELAIILAIVVLGGMGSQLGVVIAALVLIGGPELVRQLQDFRMLAFGGLMVLIMIWRPRGLLAHREPTIRLSAARRARRHDVRRAGAGSPMTLGGLSTTAEPLLRVEHLTMRFGGLVAVDDVSFAAQDRAITAIIGPNGAGKTTVFNCLTGFYKPTVGRLTLHHPAHGPMLLERMEGFRIPQRAGVARTFQNIRLFGAMSVLENLIVAQHNTLMRASLVLDRRSARAAALSQGRTRSRRPGAALAGEGGAGRSRRLAGVELALRRPATPGDRAGDVHQAGTALSRRAGGGPQSARDRGVERAAALDPRRREDRHPADRARHERGDGDLRPHRRARLRPQDRRGPAGAGAQRCRR